MIFGLGILFFAAVLGCFYYFSRYVFNILEFFNVNISKSKMRWIRPSFIFVCVYCCVNFSTCLFIVYNIIMVSFVFEIVRWIVKFIYNKKDKDIDNTMFEKIYKCGIVPFVLTIIISIIGLWNMSNLVRTQYDITTDKKIEKDMKVLFISDIHYGNVFDSSNIDACIEKMSNEDADIVVLGGDITDESTDKEGMKEVFSKLASVKNKKGIYYVFGNHDIRSKSFSKADVEETLKDNKIKILADDKEKLNDDIILAGKEDKSTVVGNGDNGNKRKENDELFDKKDFKKFVLLIDHRPCQLELDKESGVDLELCGHTHGGQVFPVGILCDLVGLNDKEYGYEKRDDFQVIVSSGAAGWGFPFRTEHHSEYVVVNISGKK